jgi:hypothetical protein
LKTLLLNSSGKGRLGEKHKKHSYNFRYEKAKQFCEEEQKAKDERRKSKSIEVFAAENNISRSTFGEWVKDFREKKLTAPLNNYQGNITRINRALFSKVEVKLIEYIDKRNEAYPSQKIGLSWGILKEKALQITNSLFDAKEITEKELPHYKQFAASDKWISDILKRSEYQHINLLGEDADVDEKTAEPLMEEFRVKILKMMEEFDVPLERVFNADQTRLYWKRLPNSMYCKPEDRARLRGTKQMKDKDGVSIMAVVSPFRKGPLAMVGKAKNPHCFKGTKPPIGYSDQENAWYDYPRIVWWLHNVFGPWYTRTYGSGLICILVLDNFSGQKINEDLLPKFIKLIFLPVKLTSRYQTLDQGVLAILKCRYVYDVYVYI